MPSRIKIMTVFGTRPEAIKMAPLIREFQKHADIFETIVVSTGQHREMLDSVLELFEITPDFNLAVMTPSQDLTDVTTRVLSGMKTVWEQGRPDIVLVHGDTTTSMAAALAAYYAQIPVGHIEAGLRTGDIMNPWPEEINRQLTARIATLHFAPTPLNRDNLIREGIDPASIIVTGNTVIDALRIVTNKIASLPNLAARLDRELADAGYHHANKGRGRKLVVITGHRRENFGEGFLHINRALKELAATHPDVDFVYPVHMNPQVREPVDRIFGDTPPGNLFLIEPLGYLPFMRLMLHATLVLTDSGGIQEEASALGKPVLLMRGTTERPEAVTAGIVKLVGSSCDRIVSETSLLLSGDPDIPENAVGITPFGDGRASRQIVSYLTELYDDQ